MNAKEMARELWGPCQCADHDPDDPPCMTCQIAALIERAVAEAVMEEKERWWGATCVAADSLAWGHPLVVQAVDQFKERLSSLRSQP